MESKKIQWNKLLNYLIISISFILASLFIGICFVVPVTKASANTWTKEDVINNNIYFNAAKTKIRTASGYNKTSLKDKNNNSFSTYLYEYNDSNATELYYSNSNDKYNSIYGNINLSSQETSQTLFDEYASYRNNEFIPYGVTHFNNNGNLEDIFYDEIDDGDFVLLDNYNNHISSTDFNVDNFYLSFGTPYNNEITHSTPLHSLQVRATLYAADGTHNLYLNSFDPVTITNDQDGKTKDIWYWYQYFDLRNLYGYSTSEGESLYSIKDQQGKYVFDFYFIRYDIDANGNLVEADTEDNFTFSFYLLDSANYNNVPIINNATLGSLEKDAINEYFYNFTSDSPTLTYNPENFNLSFARENRDILETITSSYSIGTYKLNGEYFPKGIITFSSNKKVYILTYYNADKTQVEYLYLLDNSNSFNDTNETEYSQFVNALSNNTLEFEYKVSKFLTTTTDASSTTYTTTTYKTTTYSNFALNLFDNVVTSSDSIKIEDDGDYYYNNVLIANIVEDTSNPDNIQYTTSNLNANISILNRLHKPNEIYMEVQYELAFEELGIYTFDYNYNVIINKSTLTNNNDNSTNILSIKDYDLDFAKTTNTLPIETEALNVTVWGYLDANNAITLNDREFRFDKINSKLEDLTNSLTYSLINNTYYESNPTKKHFGGMKVPTTYEIISDDKSNLILEVTYEIGSISNNKAYTYYTSQKLGKDYVVNYEIQNTQTFQLGTQVESGESISSANISTSKEWSSIKSLLEFIENNSTIISKSYNSETPNTNKDKLHIFGSITYFNKDDSTTDSEYAKLQQVDSKTQKNYISDVTKYNVENNGKLSEQEAKTIDKFKGFSKNIIGDEVDINDLIITDVTPVFWRNFSTLLYSNKVSDSYIYRYPNYNTKTGDYGDTCITSTYSKDTYCQFDGLYEVVVFYKYDYFKSLNNSENYNNTIFYQLFTFVIDNSSPSLTVKVQDDNGNYTEELGLNKYTNRNIELSWEIPTYFKNNVYIDIEKTGYGSDTSNFAATYKNGQIITTSGSAAVTLFATPSDYDKYYKVYITSDNANGKYRVTLHYSSRGASTVSEEFIIDKTNITGTEILPVIQNVNGTYSVNTDLSYDKTSQIINYDFTFRYSPKASGAKIYTYWYKIDLQKANATEYDKQLIVDDTETAITTDYKVNGKNLEDISLGNQYIYNYNKDNTVNNANYFTSNNSCIYLFKMRDEAGNECRYVIFYDTTNPRFIMSPAPTNSNNIVNDSTKITWGNYKAILIDTENSYVIDYSQTLNNTDKLNATITDNLQESLIYINSSNYFNDTKLQLIDGKYYLLLPIDSVEIKDLSSLQSQNNIKNYSGTIPSEYYFFPTNPISDNKISLPVIENNIITSNQSINISNYSITQDKFIETTNTTIYGAFGEGEYMYQVYDKQRNSSSGYLWMNLDKTQTLAQGLFRNNSDDLSQAISLTGAEGTYSAAKLYISSLEPSESVPEYSLTYKFYDFNSELYETLNNNYNLNSVKVLTFVDSSEALKITGKQTYLQLLYTENIDSTKTRTFNIN